MATYVLIHGAGSDSWYWHLVAPQLQALGHDVVAPDLPCGDDSAGLAEYADTVVDAIGERRNLILVAQSMAGFTAPMVCERLPVDLLVMLNAMVPSPGESPGDWWANTGQSEARRELDARESRVPGRPLDPIEVFLHDVPQDVIERSAAHAGQQSETPFQKPWPLERWPDVPTRVLISRNDRFFPAEFMRRVVRERLGITPDEMDCGHVPALARPAELVERLEAYRADVLG
ncbi:MAG: hydrolase, alpha/beta fold family protein [Pseudonocardiales bacterium]|nr:hydrolase, alpha/beta fold family protein [Pseudonocardiales bacterium]